MNAVTSLTQPIETIHVQVVAARNGQLWQRSLAVPKGSTIAQALMLAGYLKEFPDHSLETIAVGIYGKHVALQQPLEHNDRVELYAPLLVDPKTARRRRAAHREKTRNIKKKMPVSDLTQ